MILLKIKFRHNFVFPLSSTKESVFKKHFGAFHFFTTVLSIAVYRNIFVYVWKTNKFLTYKWFTID